jgi:soluble lytic murein transglycosylase-like protein
MDATTVAIITLFVITIMSSLGSNQGYTPPPKHKMTPPPTFAQPQTNNNTGRMRYMKINPNYDPALAVSLRTSINKYILKFRKQAQADEITLAIMRHSKSYNVNPKLVAALMRRESGYNPRAVSKTGAMGLGQLLKGTCKTTGVKQPFDINDNTKGTVRYMKYLLDKFKNYADPISFALAGYLEGPNAVARKKGYTSTTGKYVKDILNIYHKI